MRARTFAEIGIAGAIFTLAAIGTHLAQSMDRPRTAVLIFLTGVILIAARSGLLGAVIAAISASIVFNFFLSEPVYQFGITSAEEAVPLLAFNISALVAAILVGRARDSAKRAYAAQTETAFLLTVSDRLQSAITLDEIESAIRSVLPTQSVKSVEIFLSQGNAHIRPSTGQVEFDHLSQFNSENDTGSSSQKTMILRLEGARGPFGMVKFKLAETKQAEVGLAKLQSITALLALATERCILLDELAEAQVLARSEALKDALLSSVSHDLRTPVTVIQAATGALTTKEVHLADEERQKLLGVILDQCRRLERYTAELLDVGQIQTGISKSQIETIDLNETILLAIKQAKNAHPAIWIERNIPKGPVHAKANAGMLEQAIYNVIDNAYKFGGDNGPVLVELESDGKLATIAISDNGPGIPEPDQPGIFTRFFRGSVRPEQAGMGLGLFIAKGFVEAFSGSISLESPVAHGKGTRILIQLPQIEVPRIAELLQ